MGKVLFNFNNGNMNILCSNCSNVVKTAKDFTESDWKILESGDNLNPYYCNDCQKDVVDLELDSESKKQNNLEILTKILPYMAENPEFKENLINLASKKMFNNLNP
jgi:hypothetical protein